MSGTREVIDNKADFDFDFDVEVFSFLVVACWGGERERGAVLRHSALPVSAAAAAAT